MNIRIFRQVLRLLAMVLALAITSTAFAQSSIDSAISGGFDTTSTAPSTTPSTTATPSAGGQLENIKMDDFADMMQAMKITGEGYYTIFVQEGADLATVFFWISLVWLVFKLMISDKHPMVQGELATYFLKTIIVVVMLTNWVAPQTVASLGTFGNIRSPSSVKSLFVESFDQLQAPIFAKAGMNKGTMVNAIGSVWATYWKASDERGDIRDQARAKAKGKSWFAWISDSVSLTLDAVTDKVVTFFMSLLVGLAAYLLMGLYLFVIFFGDVMVIVGMTLGPLMISCLLFKRVEFIFDGWLKFIISAGFYKLIAALVAVLTMGTINTIQTQVNAMYRTATLGATIENQTLFTGGFLMSITMTLLYLAFGILMMLKVNEMTTSLMRGDFGSGAKAAQGAADQAAAVAQGKAPK